MRVKCIYDSLESCPQLKTQNNYFTDAILYITLDKEYTVYSSVRMKTNNIHKQQTKYLIINDLNLPSLHPVWLFEILDSKMACADWHFRHYVENNLPGFDKHLVEFILGYRELVSDDLKHFLGLFQGNEDDLKIFQKWREVIDELYH